MSTLELPEDNYEHKSKENSRKTRRGEVESKEAEPEPSYVEIDITPRNQRKLEMLVRSLRGRSKLMRDGSCGRSKKQDRTASVSSRGSVTAGPNVVSVEDDEVFQKASQTRGQKRILETSVVQEERPKASESSNDSIEEDHEEMINVIEGIAFNTNVQVRDTLSGGEADQWKSAIVEVRVHLERGL